MANEPADEATRQRLADYIREMDHIEAEIERKTRWSKLAWLQHIGFFSRFF